jgi:hypothetical protein
MVMAWNVSFLYSSAKSLLLYFLGSSTSPAPTTQLVSPDIIVKANGNEPPSGIPLHEAGIIVLTP